MSTARLSLLRAWSVFAVALVFASALPAQRQMEALGRGVIATRQNGGGVFVGWRLFGTDPKEIEFNVYRATGGAPAKQLNIRPIKGPTAYVDPRVDFTRDNTYTVRPVIAGREGEPGGSFTLKANPPAGYLSIPISTPRDYSPNDASVGDLDGDGEYEIVLHQAGRTHDNSQKGETDAPILQAYKLDGTLLWTINLGKNIRDGAHYTQFMVYDLDGDGRAEVACKTADGTVDGAGVTIGNAQADHRNGAGYILEGPEFLTVFNGLTGAAMATVPYDPPRHPTKLNPSGKDLEDIWGDGYGNRVDRFLACVAYLDGSRPSLVMCRGYYTRAVLVAWDWRDGQLTKRWVFDSDSSPENRKYRGQGNHQVAVADVDGDGKDEIVYGAAVIDDNGLGLYSTGWGHGDALHVSDLDPAQPGLEVFSIQERFDKQGLNFRNAATGKPYWLKPSTDKGDDGEGPGRGASFDIDPRYPGAESWAFGGGIPGLFSAKGVKVSAKSPKSCNFAAWWDGDLLRELLDRTQITKWKGDAPETVLLDVSDDCRSNNGTKATPALSGDILGDWREEVIWPTKDGKELRIYTTTIPTIYPIYTLMHDPQYRLSIAWQNVAYNQPPHVGFFLGHGMTAPPRPNIVTTPAARLSP